MDESGSMENAVARFGRPYRDMLISYLLIHWSTAWNECYEGHYRKDNVNSMHQSFALDACRAALFLALIIRLSGVGRISNSPVRIVDASLSHDMDLVSGSANMTDVSIQRG